MLKEERIHLIDQEVHQPESIKLLLEECQEWEEACLEWVEVLLLEEGLNYQLVYHQIFNKWLKICLQLNYNK